MSLLAGKLPPAVLGALLARTYRSDPRVIVGPSLGRDAAAISVGDRIIVAASDPVTFATHEPGWYAVHINANDVACLGATPAWFLATILIPLGTDTALVSAIFDQINAACSDLGIQLVGGHTEVTPAVTQPVIAGTMLGETTPDRLVAGTAHPGDAVILIGPIAVEGAALLAREAAPALSAAGVSPAAIARAAALLRDPGISIVGDALALVPHEPRLMHDPTEGGIATALHEMAQAAGLTLHIDRATIPMLDETRLICSALRLDPLGLLASGALLAIVPPSSLEGALSGAPRNATVIGHTVSGPPVVILLDSESNAPFPSFDRDEIARYFEATSQQQAQPEGIHE